MIATTIINSMRVKPNSGHLTAISKNRASYPPDKIEKKAPKGRVSAYKKSTRRCCSYTRVSIRCGTSCSTKTSRSYSATFRAPTKIILSFRRSRAYINPCRAISEIDISICRTSRRNSIFDKISGACRRLRDGSRRTDCTSSRRGHRTIRTAHQ
jgi:hypothetical protein